MNNIAVSVIVPVWNSEKYFIKCLESVISQTLLNIEIIIIDDASTDKSGVIAEKYAYHDDRIKVIHQIIQKGPGISRNIALSIAKGEYISFIDSDDMYPSNNVLNILYKKAIKKKANICGGSLYKIDSNGIIIDKKVDNQFFINEGWYCYRDYQYEGGFYRFIYNRKFLKENSLYFSEYKRFQDALFFVKTMNKAKYFYAVVTYTYAYRKNHKKIIWTYEKIYDHLSCINEILYISSIYNLNSLHYFMAKNLLETIRYRMNFFMKIYSIKRIFKLINLINWNVIKNENNKHNVKITIVKILYSILIIKNKRRNP